MGLLLNRNEEFALKQVYGSPLLTDLYQLTMGYGYFKLNMHEREAVFHLLFRRNPFKGQYAICCGLGSVIDYLKDYGFTDDDVAYLGSLKNNLQEPLFSADYLNYLRDLKFTCDIDAIPEGTIVFPNEPLLRIQGPLLQCQLLESVLLNIVNFQTLIATKASRVCRAAENDPVIEFGLRRSQGVDGALSASRAAYIGGCVGTSNTLAGKLFDIPLRGTHAHSWVTAFETEQDAFDAYINLMPYNSVLLVDTYDTIQGVKRAIIAGKKLREIGSDLTAIRLDSGDLAKLSIEARALLDAAGFENTGILASNSLDEYAITDLKKRGAKISMWGVGTNLTTSYDQPALDGVYKLSALRDAKGEWENKLKLSNTPIKISNPGRHQVRRFYSKGQYHHDVIYDVAHGISETPEAVLFDEALQTIKIDQYDASIDLLVPIMRHGKLLTPLESIHDVRDRAIKEVEEFHLMSYKTAYPVGLEKQLFDLKNALIKKWKA